MLLCFVFYLLLCLYFQWYLLSVYCKFLIPQCLFFIINIYCWKSPPCFPIALSHPPSTLIKRYKNKHCGLAYSFQFIKWRNESCQIPPKKYEEIIELQTSSTLPHFPTHTLALACMLWDFEITTMLHLKFHLKPIFYSRNYSMHYSNFTSDDN